MVSRRVSSASRLQEVDSISRKRDDVDRNDGTAWFGGNLTSAGDDYLLYEGTLHPAAFNRPVTGTAMTPGDVNTGTDAAEPACCTDLGHAECARGNGHGDI